MVTRAMLTSCLVSSLCGHLPVDLNSQHQRNFETKWYLSWSMWDPGAGPCIGISQSPWVILKCSRAWERALARGFAPYKNASSPLSPPGTQGQSGDIHIPEQITGTGRLDERKRRATQCKGLTTPGLHWPAGAFCLACSVAARVIFFLNVNINL